MSQFTPRSGNANYIKRRGKNYYYRRVIPVQFRSFFDDRTEWNIKLEAGTDAGRKAEAGALAHEHNRMMTIENIEEIVSVVQSQIDGTPSMKIDFSPEKMPVYRQLPPFEFYRDGKIVKVHKIAASSDPAYLKQAKAEGYFVMTRSEALKQVSLMRLLKTYRNADGGDEKELAKFRLNEARKSIEKSALPVGDTLRTILPKMHQQNRPRQSTMDGHKRAVEEFIALHGDLPLVSITKRHVSEYVEYLGSVRIRGNLLAPTTIKQRLEKLVAILQFATMIDAVPYNVGKNVRTPKDHRPQGDQTYKPLSKLEIRKLIEVATNVWTNRRYSSYKTRLSRKTDSITALHMLVWTGARPEEICQLRLVDVDLGRKGILITNETDEIEASNRKLKNEESVRGVPIHQALLPRLHDHIEHVRQESNSGLLFPSFEPKSVKGRYATPIGADWSKHFREHVTDDPQKVLYSLRHSWAGESARVGMSETMRNEIMGHKSDSKSSSAKRYRFHFENLENKLKWINKMDCIGN